MDNTTASTTTAASADEILADFRSAVMSELGAAARAELKIEHERMLADIAEHGKEQTGEHRGIKWDMKRPYGTYWCGYVDHSCIDDSKFTDDDCDELERLSHGGLTSGVGFDCAHYNDYHPSGLFRNNNRCTYRDYDYVLGKICGMIDYIVDRPSSPSAYKYYSSHTHVQSKSIRVNFFFKSSSRSLSSNSKSINT